MLDVAVSRYKHHAYDDLNSHCKTKSCAQNHTVSHLVVPIDELLGHLSILDHGRAYIVHQMDAYRVPRIDVTYEKLYYGPNASEWMRLLDFVGAGPPTLKNNLTMKEVEQHMDYVATHLPMRNATLANYNDIVQNFTGTEYEKLLLPVWEEALL